MASKIKLLNSEGTTLTVSNSDLLLQDKDVIYLDTVEQLTNASGSNGDVAHVSDLDRGGVFIYDSTSTDNQGTVFGSWVRQYDGAVNVRWFGAKGDGVTDDTSSFSNAITEAADNTILIPEGTYSVTGTLTGNFVSYSGVSITGGTVNYITDISGDTITVANNVAIGKGKYPALDNLAIGRNTLINSSLDSTLNIAIGTGALQRASTSGGVEDGANVAIGRSSMQDLTTGYFNTTIGTTAGQSFTTAYNCTMIGRGAGAERAQGYDNTAIGREAMYGTIESDPVVHTAYGNVAIGVSALHDVIGGDRNTAIGRSALDKVSSGNDNVAIGYASGNKITIGYNNVILGGYNGNEGGLNISTGNGNVVLSDGVGNIKQVFDSSGNSLIAKTSSSINLVGHEHKSTGVTYHTASGSAVLYLNRQSSDGNIQQFYTNGTLQGVISVNGSTVTYGGGHLARWSRFIDNSKPELLKGTVLSNLDDMIEWIDKEGVVEDNEQLNHSKVSDIEGDKDVAGVFVGWDTEDDGYNDFFIAMTGDMVIRISKNTEVKRGDILMSAGDGTAKPQEDDIIRSKSIAKVTSNKKVVIYQDGSYCVPCVLMAC
jgi:hypothetical protein